jgi:alkylated DNA nucleotide flippase Atl1
MKSELENPKTINCLYSHFKNTPKKLKIVCDWDEVIQCLEPFALYLALREVKKVKFVPKELKKIMNIAKVFWLCSQIPKGKVSTYKEIALHLYGSSKGYPRRIGQILSKDCQCFLLAEATNPSLYQCQKVNCYRVIKSNYHIGGFIFNGEDRAEVKKIKLESESVFFDKRGKGYFLKKDLRKKVIFKDFRREEDNEFLQFFETFWQSNLIDYSLYGSKLNKNFPEQSAQKNTSNFYNSAPFLSLAKELLMLVKEKKAEVIFLSAYDERVFDNGDPRKKEIFAKTFGKVPNCSLNLVGFNSEKTGKTKSEWIKENAADCNIVIDDNPNILVNVLKENDEITAVAPHYPAVANQHHKDILLVKTSVSDLKKENF